MPFIGREAVLRRLRKRVKFPFMQTAGNKIIPCTFRGRFQQYRRLDLKETATVKVFADRLHRELARDLSALVSAHSVGHHDKCGAVIEPQPRDHGVADHEDNLIAALRDLASAPRGVPVLASLISLRA